MSEPYDPINDELFSDVDFSDPFFDSLRAAYQGFDSWLVKKADAHEKAWIARNPDGSIAAMLYLKREDDIDNSINPPLQGPRMKIGTFKVDFDHHTSLGQRLVAIALREFAKSCLPYVYVTMYDAPNTEGLQRLLSVYGFEYAANKGDEQVWVKERPYQPDLNHPCKTYPFVFPNASRSWVLSIIPDFHKRLFGDIRLWGEVGMPIQDDRLTNTVEKIYLSAAWSAKSLRTGDQIIIYRTSDDQGPAAYRAVITGVCTVAAVCNINEFNDYQEFNDYIKGRSVFSEQELRSFWNKGSYPWIIDMVFDFPFNKYPIRKTLLDQGILDDSRIVCNSMDSMQFAAALKLGEVDEGYVVD